MLIMFAFASSVAAQVQEPPAKHGISVGKRLVSAIKGETEFQDTDFVKKLSAGARVALRRLAKCKVKYVDYSDYPHPKNSTVFVRDFNDVQIGFGCKDMPSDSPVGIFLTLKDGKIVKLELNNAHLMRAE